MMDARSTETRPFYPSNAETFEAHADCSKNLAGHHAGNLYCLTHRVPVKRQGN